MEQRQGDAAEVEEELPANRRVEGNIAVSATICRYCLDDEPLCDLIFPCKCTTGVHTK